MNIRKRAFEARAQQEATKAEIQHFNYAEEVRITTRIEMQNEHRASLAIFDQLGVRPKYVIAPRDTLRIGGTGSMAKLGKHFFIKLDDHGDGKVHFVLCNHVGTYLSKLRFVDLPGMADALDELGGCWDDLEVFNPERQEA